MADFEKSTTDSVERSEAEDRSIGLTILTLPDGTDVYATRQSTLEWAVVEKNRQEAALRSEEQ